MPATCPDQDTLVALLENDTQIDQEIDQHLRQCPHCQLRLDAISEPESLVGIRDRIGGPLNYPFLLPAKRTGDLGCIDSLFCESEAGRGGMGVVFRAYDESLDRRVAVKVLSSDGASSAAKRFDREARAAAAVQGDHVVNIYRVGTTVDGRPYLVMPWVDGPALSELIDEFSESPRRAAQAIRQVALGLASVHHAGIVHRDVKPANVLFDRARNRYLLSDFGLARAPETDDTLTRADVVAGTPRYMSPEQASGRSNDAQSFEGSLDATSDIYSLGITLYELLTGVPPFQGQPLQVLQQHQNAEPVKPSQLNSRVPKSLELICLKAIAKSPMRRYPSAIEFADDLLRFLEAKPILAKEVGRIEKTFLWCSRNQTVTSLIALVMLSMLSGIIATSAMWYRAAAYAQKLEETSDALQENRKDLQKSVRSFQEKVFSDESLHWQMAPEFRREMFRDVIEYLDRFAAVEANRTDGPMDDSSTESTDGIAQDYFLVAKSSEVVEDKDEYLLAMSRTFDRLRPLCGEDATAANLLLFSEAAALHAESNLSGLRKPERMDLQSQSIEAAERSNKKSPSSDSELAVLRGRFLVVNGEAIDHQAKIAKAKPILDAMRSLAHRTTEAPVFRAKAFRRSILSHWEYASWHDPSQRLAIYEDIHEFGITDWQSVSHTLNVSVLPSDHANGINKFNIAKTLALLGNDEEANEAIAYAINRLERCVQNQGQNAAWRLQLAQICTWARDHYLRIGKPDVSNVHAITTLRQLIAAKERRGNDLALSAEIIQQFCAKAEISRQLGNTKDCMEEYFIAAQDCRLLLDEIEPVARWAYEMQLFALSRIAPLYRNYPDSQLFESFPKAAASALESRGAQLFPELNKTAEAVFLGDLLPERPQTIPQLEFQW